MPLDAHVHVWSSDARRYPFAPYSPVSHPTAGAPVERLLEHWDRAGIRGGVAIQPRVYGDDHGYLAAALAAHPDRLRGVMLVDPVRGFDADAVRDTYGLGFRGIRMVALGQGAAPWLADEPATSVLRLARSLSAVVNLLVEAHQLALVRECATRFPDVPVVVDHLGYCGPWATPADRANLRALAELPKVFVKVSALGALSRSPTPYADLTDVIRECVDRFGPARLLWGTDHPHVLGYGGIERERDAALAQLAHLSPAERDTIFTGTAARLYGQWTGP
jgi:L-fuconolactonase